MAGKNRNLLWIAVFLLLVSSDFKAQSLDPSKPAPIRGNDLLGHIAARDLGDARLTDHYYAFTGTPGDLLITTQSRNLNGDLDVFTANGLRPLLKVTLYAENTRPITKSIYLRKRELLILRIEARSPNDDEGSYQLFFGGSFEPIVGGPDIAEDEASASETPVTGSNRKGKRVSSVGARLPEPEPPVTEVATAPTPEPTPVPTSIESATEEPAPAPKSTASRTPPRTRRPTARRTPAPTKSKPKETEPAVTEETNKKEEVGEVSAPAKPKSSARSTTRRGSTARVAKPEPPAETAEPESGPRLIIETNDGTLINRSMSGVRRVMVENGQVVVVGKDGKTDRILLVNVVRMSIAQ
jgi:hypothetical protein